MDNQAEMIRLYQIEALYEMIREVGWLDTYAFEGMGCPEDFDYWVEQLQKRNPGHG